VRVGVEIRVKSISVVDALLLMVMVIWGVNFTVVKVSLREMDSLAFNSIRFSLASVILLILVFSTGVTRLDRRTVARLFAIGLIGNGLYQVLFILGISRTFAGVTSLILASTPIFVSILNALIGIERVGVRGWVGIGSSFLGILLMINIGSLVEPVGLPSILGDLLILAATACWAIYTVLSRPLLSSLSPLQFVAYTVALGTPFLVLVSIPSLVNQNFAAVSWLGWAGLIFSSTLAIGFAYVVWYSGVREIGSTRTAIYENLSPVVAVLFAWQVLGERLLPTQLLGAALVFLGIYLTRFSSHQEKNKLSPG